MNYLCALVATTCFVSFVWAVFGLFKTPGTVPAAMRILSVCSTASFIWQLTTVAHVKVAPVWSAGGLALYGCALALFWWSVPYAHAGGLAIAFAEGRSTALVFTGPYRWIRHPFYSCYIMFWVAGSVAARSLPLLAPAVIMSGFYAAAIRREEAELSARRDISDYEAYRRSTGCLLPTRWSPRPPRTQADL